MTDWSVKNGNEVAIAAIVQFFTRDHRPLDAPSQDMAMHPRTSCVSSDEKGMGHGNGFNFRVGIVRGIPSRETGSLFIRGESRALLLSSGL